MEVVPDGMNLPNELEFGDSLQEPDKIGVFSRKQVNRGRLYGPFKGERKRLLPLEQNCCAGMKEQQSPVMRTFLKVRLSFFLNVVCVVLGFYRWQKFGPYLLHSSLTQNCQTNEIPFIANHPGIKAPLSFEYSRFGKSDLLPMPILEKMDFSENAAYKAPKRVPRHWRCTPTTSQRG
ncbi:hypothetical protein BSL78_27605 [Apostichopus japonicus]|uniref:Uncharacterized protein n=1 Tax=Stichopus japonicus TaxID=307972 RepID=A0A2G8JIL7_STIJA|nr:hypothetical protein BSL78_27605 [Apostichopus japonicus]